MINGPSELPWPMQEGEVGKLDESEKKESNGRKERSEQVQQRVWEEIERRRRENDETDIRTDQYIWEEMWRIRKHSQDTIQINRNNNRKNKSIEQMHRKIDEHSDEGSSFANRNDGQRLMMIEAKFTAHLEGDKAPRKRVVTGLRRSQGNPKNWVWGVKQWDKMG